MVFKRFVVAATPRSVSALLGVTALGATTVKAWQTNDVVYLFGTGVVLLVLSLDFDKIHGKYGSVEVSVTRRAKEQQRLATKLEGTVEQLRTGADASVAQVVDNLTEVSIELRRAAQEDLERAWQAARGREAMDDPQGSFVATSYVNSDNTVITQLGVAHSGNVRAVCCLVRRRGNEGYIAASSVSEIGTQGFASPRFPAAFDVKGDVTAGDYVLEWWAVKAGSDPWDATARQGIIATDGMTLTGTPVVRS